MEVGSIGQFSLPLAVLVSARRPPSSLPNTKHCLEIYVALTEELGAVPLPSHSLTAPLVEDMLHDVKTGLTKAVVT